LGQDVAPYVLGRAQHRGRELTRFSSKCFSRLLHRRVTLRWYRFRHCRRFRAKG
jgi:hypothetical protein